MTHPSNDTPWLAPQMPIYGVVKPIPQEQIRLALQHMQAIHGGANPAPLSSAPNTAVPLCYETLAPSLSVYPQWRRSLHQVMPGRAQMAKYDWRQRPVYRGPAGWRQV